MPPDARRRREFPRFSELDAARCNVEHHLHTRWSDGKPSIAEALGRASERGLSSVAFTEHVRREGSEWFADFAAEVRAVAAEFPHIEVLVGCEAKALDSRGTVDVSEDVLAECDIVLGSVHRWTGADGALVHFAEIPPEQFALTEAELALSLLGNLEVDVLAHPGGMYERRHGVFPVDLMRKIIAQAVRSGAAIEVSSSYLTDFSGFVQMCREMDPRVSIGSDAHDLESIGRCRDMILKESGGRV